ncbi:pecanex-like protein 1 [Eurytemora carolleeae]|uniref:pecanex-like protein 1 n=1 Tax=Eurytemora carolleeae TaxID=1294199 RepID=UPI000C7949AA|nr:pecanex-like protein 1 [Eurytemora carolleeae]|eukprot:XP_023334860.1 pecanex-like protein 1 [Eurytemora affinis]
MGSLLDLARQTRQGIWASLTGGWYHDSYHKTFTNTVHLYLWLFFLCFPFSIHLYLPAGSWFTWIYNGSVFLVFLLIKSLNRILHTLFDTGEVYQVNIKDNAKRFIRLILKILPLHILFNTGEVYQFDIEDITSSHNLQYRRGLSG